MGFFAFLQTMATEIGRILTLPIWWYTKGLIFWVQLVRQQFLAALQFLALDVWLKNWFVPMFGQHDWTGRIISFFMRTIQIIFRVIAAGVLACIAALAILFWLAIVPFLLYKLVGDYAGF
jgi:hypothetical protein